MPDKRQQPLLWWVIGVGAFLLFAVVLVALPYPLGNLILVALGAASLGYWTMPYLTRRAMFGSVAWGRWVSHHRLSLVVGLGQLAVGLMVLSAYWLRPAASSSDTALGGLVLLAGWGVLGVAVRLAWAAKVLPYVARPAFFRPAAYITKTHRVYFLSGLGLLVLLAEINGSLLDIPFLQSVNINIQFGMLCASLTLLALGAGGGRLAWKRPVINWQLALPIVGIVLLAVGVRFWRLQDTARFMIDEGSFIYATYIIEAHPDTPLLSPLSSIAAFPYVYPYLLTHGLNVFGYNFLGLRAASAILGIAGVLALYWLAKILFDRKTALIAALLLAVFPPHVHFSRIAINEMGGPLVATLGLAFIGRGLWRGRRLDYAAGGVLLGVAHYFDEGSRLLFLPLVIIWLVGLGVFWRPRFPLRRILLAGVLLLIVAVPIYYILVGMDRPLFARMVANQSGLAAAYWQDLFQNGGELLWTHIEYHVIPAFEVYIHFPDPTLFYIGQTGLILPVVFVFFALGVGYALARLREPGPLLLVLWILAASSGNSLLVASASSPRFVLVFPALALAIAVGVRYAVPLVLLKWPERQVNRVLWAIVLALAVIQVGYYFGIHIPNFERDARLARDDPDGYDAALRAGDFPPHTEVLIISPVVVNQLEVNELVQLLHDENPIMTVASADFNLAYVNENVRCGRDVAFFVMPDDQPTLDLIQRYFYVRFPQYTPYTDIPPGEALALYYAPYIPGVEQVKGRECP
jgi:hypothetical protein